MFEIDVKSFHAENTLKELEFFFANYTDWALFSKSSVMLQSILSFNIPPNLLTTPWAYVLLKTSYL